MQPLGCLRIRRPLVLQTNLPAYYLAYIAPVTEQSTVERFHVLHTIAACHEGIFKFEGCETGHG